MSYLSPVRTGVFATERERSDILGLMAERWAAAMLSSRHGPERADALGRQAIEKIHVAALAHGLPDFSGHYGMTKEGEFLKPSGPPPEKT